MTTREQNNHNLKYAVKRAINEFGYDKEMVIIEPLKGLSTKMLNLMLHDTETAMTSLKQDYIDGYFTKEQAIKEAQIIKMMHKSIKHKIETLRK